MLGSSSKPIHSNHFVAQLRAYLAATLHREVHLRRWDGARRLPTFLTRRYEYYAGTINERQCLFAIDLATADATPAEVEKHIALISREFDGIVVYAVKYLSTNRRARLITNGIPFVVPGNQLYVPQLAVDLREHFRTQPKRHSDHLSPVAQVVLFYNILFSHEMQSDAANRTPSRLAKLLHYTAMSIGRAFDELASAELAEVIKHGRTKQIHFASDRRALIDQSRPLLRNPARTQKYAQGCLLVPPMKIAGQTALSNLTGLSSPRLPVYAVHTDEWRAVAAGSDIAIVDDPDQAESTIEFWHYHPDALSDYATVDPLSLYAQLWDDPNERIAKAAEEALDHVAW
jgi:hypothetical protein